MVCTRSIIWACLAALAVVSPALAEVTVTRDDAKQRVVVEANDATVDDILKALGKEFDFKSERTGISAEPAPISGRYEGALDDVMQRVLRGEGHMIVRSREARSGVVRVVLFGSANSKGTAVAERKGRLRPTQGQSNGPDEEEALAQAEADQIEAEQQAQAQALQARALRKQKTPPQQRQRPRPGNDHQ